MKSMLGYTECEPSTVAAVANAEMNSDVKTNRQGVEGFMQRKMSWGCESVAVEGGANQQLPISGWYSATVLLLFRHPS